MIGIAQFPHMAMKNRQLVEESTNAGCYCCMKMIEVKTITEYTDDGKTVICPLCNVDAIVYGPEITEDLLKKGNGFWFKR